MPDQGQRSMIADVDLRAGRRAFNLSDMSAALILFQNGISFLGSDQWSTSYDLAINLYEGAAEAACVTNNREAVQLYAGEVFSHAKCADDKLICEWLSYFEQVVPGTPFVEVSSDRSCRLLGLYALARLLSYAEIQDESINGLLEVLQQLGEEPLLPISDPLLVSRIQATNNILHQTSDEAILNLPETEEKKVISLQKVYNHLTHLFHFRNQSLIGAVTLRMVELTLNYGFCSLSAVGFSYYAERQASLENYDLAIRLGQWPKFVFARLVRHSFTHPY